MKAAFLTGREKIELREIPIPTLGDNEVLVKVKCAAICGTDVRMYKNYADDANPIVLGHEISGIIEKVGKNVKAYQAGLRVAIAPNIGCGICDACISGDGHLCETYQAFGINLPGGFSEYVKAPENAVRGGNIFQIGENVSFEAAAVNEPFSCVYNGFEQYRVKPGDSVLVVGGGPIGILHIKLAVMAGAAQIILSDLSEKRRALVQSLVPQAICIGADQLKENIFQITNGRGVDVCVTACPSASVQAQAVELMARGGRVCFFGGLPKNQEPVPIDTNIVHYKQLILTGSTRASLRQYGKTMSFIQSGLVNVDALVTHRFTLDEIQKAMNNAVAGEGIKTVITFA